MLKRPEIVLGFLASGVFWIAVLGWATSYDAPTEQQKKECYQAAQKTSRNTEECKTFWERTTSDPVAMFTLVLAFSTIGLWGATLIGIRNQSRETKILQRAYLAVESAGINPLTNS